MRSVVGSSTQADYARPHIAADRTHASAPPVAGAAALPPSNVCQGMGDGHALPPLRPPLRGLLACAPLLHQGVIGRPTDAAPRSACRAACPQQTAPTRGCRKVSNLSGRTGQACAARTRPGLALPIALERLCGTIRALAYRPRLTENGHGLGALWPQRPGPLGPGNGPGSQGALLRREVRFDRVRPPGFGRVGRGAPHGAAQARVPSAQDMALVALHAQAPALPPGRPRPPRPPRAAPAPAAAPSRAPPGAERGPTDDRALPHVQRPTGGY
jgi:hypothetical protein